VATRPLNERGQPPGRLKVEGQRRFATLGATKKYLGVGPKSSPSRSPGRLDEVRRAQLVYPPGIRQESGVARPPSSAPCRPRSGRRGGPSVALARTGCWPRGPWRGEMALETLAPDLDGLCPPAQPHVHGAGPKVTGRVTVSWQELGGRIAVPVWCGWGISSSPARVDGRFSVAHLCARRQAGGLPSGRPPPRLRHLGVGILASTPPGLRQTNRYLTST